MPEVPNIKISNYKEMPALGFSVWQEDYAEVKKAVNLALECGYRHLDISTSSKNMEAIGEVLFPWVTEGKVSRQDLFITIKLPMAGGSYLDPSRFLSSSLNKLSLSYVDLYLIHRPVVMKRKDDENCPSFDGSAIRHHPHLPSLWKAMQNQVDIGRAKSIGLSNFGSREIQEIVWCCSIRPANVQIELHAYHQQKNIRAYCEESNISVSAFAPLGAPYMEKSPCEPHPLDNHVVTSMAYRVGKTPAQVLLRHLVQHQLAVISVSAYPSQIEDNFQISEQVFDFELSEEDMEALDDLDRGHNGEMLINQNEIPVTVNIIPEVPKIQFSYRHEIPVIGLGTWQAEDSQVRQAVNSALECGYRHFDTSTDYGNEEAIGEVLHEWISKGKLEREDLYITAKLPMTAIKPSDVSRYLNYSLCKLQLSYIDLYLMQCPVAYKGKHDGNYLPFGNDGKDVLDIFDLKFLWKVMEDQVYFNRVKAIGISNFNSEQTEAIVWDCRISPAYLQVELHAYHQQKDLRKKFNIPVCAFAPLGAPYMPKSPGEHRLLQNPVVTSIASRERKTPAQVLLRHLIQHELIVIPKSTNPNRIEENIQVFDFELSKEDMESLDNLDLGSDGKMFKDKCPE